MNLEAARRRRNYALERMAAEGFITREEAEAAKQKPIVTRGEPGQDSSIAPYFLEEVRKYVEAKYGAKALYENGLTVRTSLDPELQRAANRAVDRGLRQVARRRGIWRKPARNVLTEGHTLDGLQARSLDARHRRRRHRPGRRDCASTPRETRAGDRARAVRHATPRSSTRPAYQWTRRTHAADLVQPGDLVEVGIATLDESRARRR